LEQGERQRIYDGEMAIDRIVKVKVERLKYPLSFTVQERFRQNGEMQKYMDITITEWNNVSDLPSELYKLAANIFVYGDYDENTDQIEAAIAFDVPRVLYSLATLDMPFQRSYNKRSQQHFVTIKIEDIKRFGCLIFDLGSERSGIRPKTPPMPTPPKPKPTPKPKQISLFNSPAPPAPLKPPTPPTPSPTSFLAFFEPQQQNAVQGLDELKHSSPVMASAIAAAESLGGVVKSVRPASAGSNAVVAWDGTASADPFRAAVGKALGFDAPDDFLDSFKAEYKIELRKMQYVVTPAGEVVRFFDDGVASIARFHWRRLHDSVHQ
jgi:hypothetical protein